MLNAPLLDKMVDFVTTSLKPRAAVLSRDLWHENVWNQQEWFLAYGVGNDSDKVIITESGIVGLDTMKPCGTAGCLAGQTVLHEAPAGTVIEDGGVLTLPDGSVREVGEYAAELLGLRPQQASALFCGSNSAATLRRLADTYIAEAANA